ncbi:M23 family metallopeptidase [Microbacterium enclense]|uniref:M23 family metallopeptidase n=1 Tax=Microbacterium enclense TaxID=993073 RepID=UPI003D7237D0
MTSLNNTSKWIEDLKREIARLKSGAFLENSSITDGTMRFIRGLLRLDSGARLEGVGTFDWTGPGSIAGDWEVLGGGVIRVGGVLISPVGGGRIMIGAGPVAIILDGGSGTLTMGNIRMEGGKIYAGTGAERVVIDGATGKLLIGSMELDPTSHSGYIKMPNGAELLGYEANVEMYSAGPIKNGLIVTPTGAKVQTLPSATSLDGLHWVARDPITGELFDIAPGVGGPEASLSWPLPPSMITDEYGPRESPGEGASTFHEGMDFGAAEGTPIAAAGPGMIILAGVNGGYGNCVIIDHGNGIQTLYGHMVSTPPVSAGDTVARGQNIGAVGNTGTSFGAHLHFEVHVDGVAVNPRSKLPAA